VVRPCAPIRSECELELRDDLDGLRALPVGWRAQLGAKEIIPVTAGMTDAHVYRIADRAAGDQYLKIGTGGDAAHLKHEVERTQWLASMGIRVPRITKRFAGPDVFAFMMTALNGKSADDAITPDNAPGIVEAVARALAAIHALPVAACPFDERLDIRLARARDLMRRGMIDPADFDARNAGMSAEQLYDRLQSSIPADADCVVTHGDATLSNLILGNDGQIGFVDCGHAGVADRYLDLAVTVGEIDERVGRDLRVAFAHAYGNLAWNAPKAAFYRDLYELF
jgi:aminoglycoside phosphotransferase